MNHQINLFEEDSFKRINNEDIILLDLYDKSRIINQIDFPERIILVIDDDFDSKSVPYKALILPINYNVDLKNISSKTFVFKGKELIVLNQNLTKFKESSRKNNLKNVVISLGGSFFYDDLINYFKSLFNNNLFNVKLISKHNRIKDSIFHNDILKYYLSI